MAPEPGNASSRVLCGAGRRGGKGGGNLAGGQAAVSTCLLPAPLSQNRFGQSEVQEGGWNNGSPMPRRGSEGPQTDILKMGEALLFLPGDRQVTPLLELPKCEMCSGGFLGLGSILGVLQRNSQALVSSGILRTLQCVDPL